MNMETKFTKGPLVAKCRRCNGEGYVLLDKCRECNGTGNVIPDEKQYCGCCVTNNGKPIVLLKGQSSLQFDSSACKYPALHAEVLRLRKAAKHFTECEFDSQGRAVIRVEPDKIEALRAALQKAEQS